MSSINRRRSDRYPFSSRLEVSTRRDLLPADAVDVSVGGFGFRARTPIQPGELITVTMSEMRAYDEPHDFPDLPSLRIVAVVRHLSPTPDGSWLVGAERHA